MARKSLRPHLNQIRTWVRQGRTDAWVAHQLDVSVKEIEQFKRQNELIGEDEPGEGVNGSDYPEEIDLRAEDDALIAAELEAAEAEAERLREEDAAGRGGGRRGRGNPGSGPPQPPRRTAAQHTQRGPAGGHLRPRRGGVRPVA